jgi:hypothetical protein
MLNKLVITFGIRLLASFRKLGIKSLPQLVQFDIDPEGLVSRHQIVTRECVPFVIRVISVIRGDKSQVRRSEAAYRDGLAFQA